MPSQISVTHQPTLIFIPDISGFTRFVHDNEVNHSRHITEELLEILIDSNEIGLQVSEIEGDAVLFYRQGIPPTAAELLAQVQKMYVNFHAHIKKYDALRICQCGACTAASGLALKCIIHYGDLSMNQVKDFTKLFGKDLIVAHRLMKNNISLDEYVLITHQLLNACSAWVDVKQVAWEDPAEGEGIYDGEAIKYCYLPLKPLLIHVPEPRVGDYSVHGANAEVMRTEAVIRAPIELVFDVASDVSFRHHWMAGLIDSTELNGKITRQGSTHRCVLKATDKDPFLISHNFTTATDVVTWIESDAKAKMNSIFKLERIGKQLTRISYTLLLKPGLIQILLFNIFFKKKITGWIETSFKNLDNHCHDLSVQGKLHTEQVVINI